MIELATLSLATLCCLAATSAKGQQLTTIGDEKLRLKLELRDGVIVEREFLSNGEPVGDLTAAPWSLVVDGKPLTPTNGRLVQATRTNASFSGEDDRTSWNLSYEVTGSGRIAKMLSVKPKQDLLLNRVVMWDANSPTEPAVSRTELQDIAAFYRQNQKGLFASLDFPYSKITCEGSRTLVSYPPEVKLKARQVYECHSLTIGATSLTGRARYGFDDGEVEAMDSYIQERFQPRFDRPMYATACINNRYTQLDGKGVFYTMADHPTLGFNLDLLRREIALMPELGIEYYQLFPGVFDWVPDDPKPSDVREIVSYANKHGVKIGDYSGTNSLFCGHYNEYGNSLAKPEWRTTGADGGAGGFCFGCPEFVDHYINTVVPNSKKYGFDMHCMDFLGIHACHAADHGHLAGAESVYHQVLGLTRLLEAINGVSPEMMIWPNSGNWLEFLPKLAWYAPNLYLTDPYIDKPWQALNATTTMDDVRREQMVRLHYTHFLPYRFFTNCQYFFCQNSIVPDTRCFEYGALSTLAVTPNLCLAEIRPWMDTLPSVEQERIKAFYTEWTGFLKRNYDLWKKTYSVGENPGPGAVEIYGHCKGSRGFVFVVNPSYWGRTVDVPLDASIGLDAAGPYEIAELHPIERLRQNTVGSGSTVSVHVPARQVIVLEIRPVPRTIVKPRLYGIPGSVEKTESGYLVKTTGPQGATQSFSVVLPPGSDPITSAEVRPDVPKQPKRAWEATPVKLISSSAQGALFEITYRRGLAPTELRDWRAKPGTLADSDKLQNGYSDGELLSFPLFADAEGVTPPVWDDAADKLGLGSLANFCGGYIDNAFSEQQETWIDLRTAGATPPGAVSFNAEFHLKSPPLPPLAKSAESGWWVQTTFKLPFIYSYGMEPKFDDHTILALPFIRRGQVSSVKAWLNGAPLDVRDYRYPRNRALGCYWADLVGTGAHSGDNTLVVYFEAAE